jgi:cytoskeletal protein RodZ
VFGRKEPQRTQTQAVMDELAESYGHLRRAAGHLAGGAAEKLTPPYDRARFAASRSWITTKDAFAPMYEQMREGAANARREQEVSKPNRWPALVGLLAAGAAVGAAGAMVARRRRAAAQWEDYDPMTAMDEAQYGEKPSAAKKVAAGAATVADSVSSQAGKVADSLHEKSASTKPSPKDKSGSMADQATNTTGDVVDRP